MTLSTATALRQAADLLVRDGWCQGSRRGPNGERFVSAAINRAPLTVRAAAFDAMYRRIWATGPQSLSDWNDQPGRTQDEVVDTLRSVADEIEGEA